MHSELDAHANSDNKNDGGYCAKFQAHDSHETKQLDQYQRQNDNLKYKIQILTRDLIKIHQ